MSDFRVFHHHVDTSTFVALMADVLLCFFAAPFVVAMVWEGSLGSPHLEQAAYESLWMGGSYAVVMPLLCSAVGLYRRNHVEVTASAMAARGLLALGAGAVVTYVTFDSFRQESPSGMMIATVLGYVVIALLLVRLLMFAIQKAVGRPRVLIVGTGAEARDVASDLATLKRTVVGYYPTSSDGRPESIEGKVFSRAHSVEDIVAQNRVTEIVVAAREQRGGAVNMDELLACRIRGVPVMDLAAFYERSRSEVRLDSLKASWLVYGSGFVQGGVRRFAKRTFDIVSSAMLLALASPIMLLTALAIKLESPGPVIYRQERVGYLGSRFMCLKFRSMRTDAESDGVARWAVRNDARITRVGSLIRKARIDELPQLISVLRGEMSMVGPRPERPSFVESLREEISYYDLRHSVKPGLTGWAQIRYRYGASVDDARRKHQFDLYYIKNNSLFLDLLVLIETVTVVLFGEGAN